MLTLEPCKTTSIITLGAPRVCVCACVRDADATTGAHSGTGGEDESGKQTEGVPEGRSQAPGCPGSSAPSQHGL